MSSATAPKAGDPTPAAQPQDRLDAGGRAGRLGGFGGGLVSGGGGSVVVAGPTFSMVRPRPFGLLDARIAWTWRGAELFVGGENLATQATRRTTR